MSALLDRIIQDLRANENQKNLAGMARYGISTDKAFGISAPTLRKMAKEFRGNQALAFELWDSGYREARLMATFIAKPKAFTPEQMDRWIADCDSWDVCDATANQLFRYSSYAYDKALEWAESEETFTRRAGFSLMAGLALKSAKIDDDDYEPFLQLITEKATDERNMVKKAVNWALRQIGKRNTALNEQAIVVGEAIQQIDSKSAKWIANDALRELRSDKVQATF